ncbi:hypothetical protein LCGC14_1200070 [marine sediment metagenome]|uniref:Uncharacterized protein n=1 Tax=marine sediment metagenome TaxID=412755 RepID=A0A0F9M4K6_9ZZZZ
MKRINYIYGDNLNGLIFIKEIEPQISLSRKSRRAIFKCFCGKEFGTIIRSIISGNTKSCGCFGLKSRSSRFTKHGLRQHPLYRVWCSIKTRCSNQSRADYRYYGGKGIKLSEEFSNDFLSFYNYVISLDKYDERESKKLTLDRISNVGDYDRGNLRWATRKEQANNRGNNVKT